MPNVIYIHKHGLSVRSIRLTHVEADNDETRYEPEQQSCGFEGADWQNIINLEGVKVMFVIDKPKSLRPPQEPSIWV